MARYSLGSPRDDALPANAQLSLKAIKSSMTYSLEDLEKAAVRNGVITPPNSPNLEALRRRTRISLAEPTAIILEPETEPVCSSVLGTEQLYILFVAAEVRILRSVQVNSTPVENKATPPVQLASPPAPQPKTTPPVQKETSAPVDATSAEEDASCNSAPALPHRPHDHLGRGHSPSSSRWWRHTTEPAYTAPGVVFVSEPSSAVVIGTSSTNRSGVEIDSASSDASPKMSPLLLHHQIRPGAQRQPTRTVKSSFATANESECELSESRNRPPEPEALRTSTGKPDVGGEGSPSS
ncbi:hypothetical protein PHYPSEUDO_004252 [Phytophthora pseudosyringae]|uniref:Uncharacterized protein n=1 Tax=Phytophthora pseudosyringae TaxID=221518 RepID=A0A8T1VNP2_9STRA|nr:hypothetical protein PHYPSEUDO_004252 [Phytophthora pseudosyringae]